MRTAGEGATAVVHEARARDDGGREVALKIARDADGDAIVAREAEILGALERRWAPSLVSAGRVPEGVGLRAGASFVATEWARGVPLGDGEGGAKRDREELAAIVAHGVSRALDEMHALGVRHGDVKPANIVVAGACGLFDRPSDRGATLLDVGLAARVDAPLAGATPRYLAPEVRRGEPPGAAADLWALGVVLAEIVAPDSTKEAEIVAPKTRTEVGAWIAALLAPAPGARPSAAWVASRAARVLELAPDDDEEIAARRARVRRTYLAVRGRLRASRVGAGVTGLPRRWLEEAIARAPRDDVRGSAIEPLDAMGLARWLVALVGPSSAEWPTSSFAEGPLAERMFALAAHAPPEAWTAEDLAHGDVTASRIDLAEGTDRWLALTRALLRPAPDARLVAIAEDDVAGRRAPPSLAIDLARVLVRRGEIGRAFAALARAGDDTDALLLRADVARRRGDAAAATKLARRALPHDEARALLARLAWDAGDLDRAEHDLGDARGAFGAEVRALVAYARGDYERGLAVVDAASREAHDALGAARLEGTRGMLEHARGRAAASLAAFGRAGEIAAREGAIVEEATYLTGLAAAAVDAGATARALEAATRAALMWERLGRPALAARALLSRAAAYALVGASHAADEAASLARARALESGDARAAAFARWAHVETRPPGDARARDEAVAADAELAGASDEDRIRSAARVLVWADGAGIDVEAIDASVASRSTTARWEWWGARASAIPPSPRALAEIVSLLDAPAPLGSRGPALAAAIRLAETLGDGDAARRLETARRVAAEALRAGAPPEHLSALASAPWARAGEAAPSFSAPQLEQLDTIVRSLSSRDRLRPLLEQALDALVLWTGVERGLLLLRAPDGRLVPRAARNLARRDLRGEQLALSMGLAKRAMDDREAVCATDAYAQIGDLHASVHALRLRSVLAVPLVARGDVLGVVYLDDRVRRGAFGAGELAWVRLVASQAALAIADARDQALLRRAVRRAERASAKLAGELDAASAELASIRSGDTKFAYDEIAGRSEPMRAMLKVVDRVTASDVPVLLVGESGTGKELVARAIHANGARASHAFVSENCASVPETLLESTLFGHVRGAFTGASATRAGLFDVADGGTLFLDEIGEMPASMQTKLLRVLQNGDVRPVGGERTHRVDVRIVGATHRDLEAMVAAGTFREDLFYRLNVVSVRIPPLRERPSDIPLLVAHFVAKHAPDRKIKVTRSAMDRLVAFPWPGNVRQLENEIRRALVLAEDRIDLAELGEEVTRGGPSAARESGLGLKARVDALETQLVRDAMARTKGNQTRAAQMLGISRFGLQKMMRRLGISGVS
ncbi:MAG TPA: sigma 54-interacting transcriptional regulator [Labilithrix sp.]